MDQDWLDLSAASWTVRADQSAAAWGTVPEQLKAKLAEGIPATVPGVVHTDLLAAGLLADPYLGTAEADQHWVGDQTWVYSATVSLPELGHEHYDLVCDGLDTVAEVLVNGESVGRSANQHRRNTFEIRPALTPGENVIEVRFTPALEYADQLVELLGARPHVEKHPFNMIRKMACNFGWDWGPCLITAGIWKTIGLRGWSHARVADVSVAATAAAGDHGWNGRLRVRAQLVGDLRFAAVTVRVSGNDAHAEMVVPAAEWTELDLEVSGIRPWWPWSLGDQPCYDIEVTFHNDVRVLDRVSRRTGFRTATLDTTPDSDGEGAKFALQLNGAELFVRGADWIPDDCFPSRVTPDRYRERIQQAKDANIDLLRVWGGGLYEQDAFYDACDELGVLVWQDFALACAAYPEEEPLRSEIEAEARDNVMRLSPHPSLAVWCGCNENIWGKADWGWDETLGELTWGAGYYYDLFPKVLAELDPSRPYWPGSPASGVPDVHPNSPDFGCMHIWDVWNERDYTGYDDYAPRFVSEFGYQGPATFATWARTLPPSDRAGASPAMLAHQKAADGNGKLTRGLAGHLLCPGETADAFDDWLYAMQLQQARAVRHGVDRWRSLRGRCLGSVVWQLNDCWPVTSWAALDLGTDAAGAPVARRKPLWHALRAAYADRVAVVQHEDGAWRLALVNDGRDDWDAVGTVRLRRLDGEVVWSKPLAETLGPRSRVDVALDAPPDERGLAWDVDVRRAERYVRLLDEDVAAGLPAPGFEATVDETPRGVAVTVTATTFLRSLCLFADRLDENALVDTCMVDLFPGESHTFEVAGTIADHAALTDRPVLRCVAHPLIPSEVA